MSRASVVVAPAYARWFGSLLVCSCLASCEAAAPVTPGAPTIATAGPAATAAPIATAAPAPAYPPPPVYTAAPAWPYAPPGMPVTAAPEAAEGGGFWGAVLAVVRVLLWLLLVSFVLRGAANWYAARNRRRWGIADTADEVHYDVTPDGWRIAVHRWLPREGAPLPGARPVVLCHGLGANRFNVDCADRSLARWLRDRGYDVWAPELRGAGLSDEPKRHDWTFDEHVEQDVPAVLRLVTARTGARDVDWVGHSMGGLVMLAHLPGDDGAVRSLCAVGSPAALTGTVHRRFRSLMGLARFIPRWLMPRVPLATGAALVAPLAAVVVPRWQEAFYNPKNVDPAFRRRLSVSVPTDVGRELLRQFGEWYDEGSFRSVDRRRDYAARLAQVRAPVLLIGGNVDRLAPPETIQAVAGKLGGRVRVVFAGKEHGHGVDYGHSDLLVGDHAARDIFPIIQRWLEEQARATTAREAGAPDGVGAPDDGSGDADAGARGPRGHVEPWEDEDPVDTMDQLGAEATVPVPPERGEH